MCSNPFVLAATFLAATLLTVGTLGCRNSSPAQDTTDSRPGRDNAADKTAVSQVGEREVRAFNAKNIDSNVAVLAEDVVMMPAGEPMFTGRDAARAWLKRVHDQYTINLRYTASQVDVAGDWAIERFTLETTATPKKGGAAMKDRGKGIHIYRRQPDGSWLIAQDIWNSDLSSPVNP